MRFTARPNSAAPTRAPQGAVLRGSDLCGVVLLAARAYTELAPTVGTHLLVEPVPPSPSDRQLVLSPFCMQLKPLQPW